MKSENAYSCSQPDLYSVCTYIWNSCQQDIAAFNAFNSKYTAAFVLAQLAAVEDARLLKSHTSLVAENNKVRVLFDNSKEKCLTNTQWLKQYILDTFSKDLQPANLKDAGLGFYEKAAEGNWAAFSDMLTLGAAYMQANLVALTDAHMPAAFATTFAAAASDCFSLFKQLGQLADNLNNGVNAKVQANNAIYAALTAMLGNAKQIYAAKKAQKRRFVFSTVLREVRGAGIAGLCGTVTSADTNKPVVGAIVSVPNTDYVAVTDKKGRYHIKQILAAPYTFQVQAPDFALMDKLITIKPGVTSRASFVLPTAESVMRAA